MVVVAVAYDNYNFHHDFALPYPHDRGLKHDYDMVSSILEVDVSVDAAFEVNPFAEDDAVAVGYVAYVVDCVSVAVGADIDDDEKEQTMDAG